MMRVRYQSRRGISMAETVVSSLIIGFVLVSTLQIVGPMIRSESVHADRLIASNLANELIEEIATKRFADPDVDSPDDIGVDGSERSGQRSDFDDIDDYHGWSSSPPKLSTGQSNIYLGGWARSVDVYHVELPDANTKSATYTGLKRVIVRVSKNGTQLAKIESVHSSAAEAIGFLAP